MLFQSVFLACVAAALNSDNFLQLDFTRGKDSGLSKKDLGGFEYVPLISRSSMYLVNLQVGSDRQNISVMLDTGSSDLWFPSSNVQCEAYNCSAFGSYNHDTSSSYTPSSLGFNISYVDGTGSSGLYVKDDIYFGQDTKLEQFQFGDINVTSSDYGVLGVGMKTSEMAAINDHMPYANFPHALKEQGLIGRAGYSLYLNEPNAVQGSILFGAIDTEKYQGQMVTLPVAGNRLAVNSTNIEVGGTTLDTGFPIAFDSGYTYTELPSTIQQTIAQKLNGTYLERARAYEIACDQPDDQFIEFNFDLGASFRVPYSSLVLKTQDYCFLGVLKSGEANSVNKPPTLGDNVLRHAYIFYDLDRREISFAQARYTKSSVIVTVS